MSSPYFCPGKRRQRRISMDGPSSHNRREEDERLRNIDQAIGQPQDQPMFNNPLFRSYVRSFLDLYQQLSLLKPKLIQESVADDPWKLLVAVTLLNKTTSKAAIPIFWELMKRWPSPWAMSQADQAELRDHIYRLGIHNVRSQRLIEMSIAYIRDPPYEHDARPSRPQVSAKQMSVGVVHRHQGNYSPTPISHLPGIGSYALDSYRIFCPSHNNPFCDEWKAVLPTDKELVLYLRWKWAYEERKEWSPLTGRVVPADIPFLEALIEEFTKYHVRSAEGRNR